MSEIGNELMLDWEKAMLEEVIVQTLFESNKVFSDDVHDLADELLEAILDYKEGFEV
jgi:hypothetical protein